MKQGNVDALRWLYPEFSVSLSNLMSRENEGISCENLEKYGGGYFRNLTSFERFAAEILSFSPTSARFLLIHAVRFERGTKFI